VRARAVLLTACLLACGRDSLQQLDTGSLGPDAGPPAQTAPDAGPPAQTVPDAGPPAENATDAGPVPTRKFSLSIQLSGNGAVISSPAAISCGTSCAGQFDDGTSVLLTAFVASGGTFTGWSGACAGLSSTCTVVMNADRAATASFAAPTVPPPVKVIRTLTVALTGSGQVTSTPLGIDCPAACTASYDDGTVVALTAAASEGFRFDSWTGACSGSGSCSVSVTSDLQVGATFVALPCFEITPAAEVAMDHWVEPVAPLDECREGVGDAFGTMALWTRSGDPAGGTGFDLAVGDRSPPTSSTLYSAHTAFSVQQPSAFFFWGYEQSSGPIDDQVSVFYWPSPSQAFGVDDLTASGVVSAGDPVSGMLLAGEISSSFSAGTSFAQPTPAVMMYGTDPAHIVRWGPLQLASAGTVAGAGVDLQRRSLVHSSGSPKFPVNTLTGQWFDVDGNPMTGEFAVLFSAPLVATYDTAPLIGGGLLVRMTTVSDGVRIALPLVALESGTTVEHTAPDWLFHLLNTRLQIVRGGKAYAVLPDGAPGVSCSQDVQLRAPDGTLCSTSTYPIAGGTCDTRDLTLTADGTVIQPLPSALESITPTTHSCTWRWWPATLQ